MGILIGIGGLLLLVAFLVIDIGGLIYVWHGLRWWEIALWILTSLRIWGWFISAKKEKGTNSDPS